MDLFLFNRLYREYCALREGRLQQWLDAGYGACALRRAEMREIVERSLLRFDGERYAVYAFVVMPNHVHVLFMPLGERVGADIVREWKSVTGHALNRALGLHGVFWQDESFDRLVRDAAHFERCRSYIRSNDPLLAYDAKGEGA